MTPAIDTATSSAEDGLKGLAPELLTRALRLMYTSRLRVLAAPLHSDGRVGVGVIG